MNFLKIEEIEFIYDENGIEETVVFEHNGTEIFINISEFASAEVFEKQYNNAINLSIVLATTKKCIIDETNSFIFSGIYAVILADRINGIW